MKRDDVTNGENLLADKEALSEVIKKGEQTDASSEEELSKKSEASSQEAELNNVSDSEPINVYSDNPNMKWYIVYVRTGHEQKAKEQLEQRIKSEGKKDDFAHVLVPTENVVEVAKGKRRTGTRKFFPGYMLLQIIMN
jgi:hypothetical protein